MTLGARHILAACLLVASLLCLQAAADTPHQFPHIKLQPGTLTKLLPDLPVKDPRFKTNLSFARSSLVRSIGRAARRMLETELGVDATKIEAASQDDPYSFFRFIPVNVANAMPNAGPTTWSGRCFTSATVTATSPSLDYYQLKIDVGAAAPSVPACSELFLITTPEAVQLVTLTPGTSQTLQWPLAGTASLDDRWLVAKRGFHLLQFNGDLISTLLDVLATVGLLEPFDTMAISDKAMALNLAFMKAYAQQDLKERPSPDVDVDEALLKSGDMMTILRMDGLDPMLAWAMGSATGHVAMVLRIKGEAYVVESTTSSGYWPLNGLQRTPYKLWMQQVRSAMSNVVWAPLTGAARAAFNETAALEWFTGVEGTDYGFSNFLLGWLDTEKDNFPCLPPDYKRCIGKEVFELIATAADRLLPPEVPDRFLFQALNKRLGTVGLRSSALLRKIFENGNSLPQVMAAPENDAWIYNTTRYDKPYQGISRVCCAFVCSMWKAGGLFKSIQNQVNCAEQTNWDVYSMEFVDPAPARPAACISSDPDNKHCQIAGRYTLNLNDVGSRKVYPRMGENCPTIPPFYPRTPGC